MDELMNLMQKNKLMLLLGPSGSGKTRLVTDIELKYDSQFCRILRFDFKLIKREDDPEMVISTFNNVVQHTLGDNKIAELNNCLIIIDDYETPFLTLCKLSRDSSSSTAKMIDIRLFYYKLRSMSKKNTTILLVGVSELGLLEMEDFSYSTSIILFHEHELVRSLLGVTRSRIEKLFCKHKKRKRILENCVKKCLIFRFEGEEFFTVSGTMAVIMDNIPRLPILVLRSTDIFSESVWNFIMNNKTACDLIGRLLISEWEVRSDHFSGNECLLDVLRGRQKAITGSEVSSDQSEDLRGRRQQRAILKLLWRNSLLLRRQTDANYFYQLSRTNESEQLSTLLQNAIRNLISSTASKNPNFENFLTTGNYRGLANYFSIAIKRNMPFSETHYLEDSSIWIMESTVKIAVNLLTDATVSFERQLQREGHLGKADIIFHNHDTLVVMEVKIVYRTELIQIVQTVKNVSPKLRKRMFYDLLVDEMKKTAHKGIWQVTLKEYIENSDPAKQYSKVVSLALVFVKNHLLIAEQLYSPKGILARTRDPGCPLKTLYHFPDYPNMNECERYLNIYEAMIRHIRVK